jgi:tetratricopeptide (TPR) repeat protein
MAYPGNTELSPQAQDRVMTAFKQVVGKLQQGNRQEALIGLEFVLRLDPQYAPALNLQQQLSTGAGEIDLNEVVAHLQAPTTDAIDGLLVEAVEDFNEHNFEAARAKVNQVLLDLPGHREARELLRQIEESTKGNSQVRQFLSQAKKALDAGDSQEAANFVMMAQALDPHHRGIAETIAEIEQGGVSLSQAGFAPAGEPGSAVSFDAGDDDAPDFSGAAATVDMFAEATFDAPAAPPVNAPAAPGVAPPPRRADASHNEAATPRSEPYYETAAEDVSDLFQDGPAAYQGPSGGDADDGGTSGKIRALLARGGAAAAADDYAAAIDAWSRVLLIDPAHEEASDRIEHIRHAKEEVDRRIEPMLIDAQEALEDGNEALAKDFVDRILSLAPHHFEGSRLAERLGGPTSAPQATGGGSDMPDLEDDLFSEEFVATPDFGSGVGRPSATLEGEWRTPKKPKRRLPWQWWVGIGAAGAALVVFSLWVASSLMPEEAPPEPRVNVVNRVLIEAAEMYNKGQIEEAIVHLEANSADDVFQVRIDNRLAEYRQKVATPVPTPIPEGLAACRSLLAEGRWMAAFRRVKEELRLHPNDPGLEEVKNQILEVEPEAANLYSAAAAGDHRAVVAIARDLLESRPEDSEVIDVYERALFNAGMTELRAFNLPESESFLAELAGRQPGDEEVQRVIEFVNTYKSRPADMQLEIFVGSIPLR